MGALAIGVANQDHRYTPMPGFAVHPLLGIRWLDHHRPKARYGLGMGPAQGTVSNYTACHYRGHS